MSLPERHCELPARLMAEAILASTASSEPVSASLRAAARATGRELGRRAGQLAGRRPDGEAAVAAVCGALEAEGVEPANEPLQPRLDPAAGRCCVTLTRPAP